MFKILVRMNSGNLNISRSISRDFFLADHTLPTHPELPWPEIAPSPLNDTTQPVDIEQEGWSSTMEMKALTVWNETEQKQLFQEEQK